MLKHHRSLSDSSETEDESPTKRPRFSNSNQSSFIYEPNKASSSEEDCGEVYKRVSESLSSEEEMYSSFSAQNSSVINEQFFPSNISEDEAQEEKNSNDVDGVHESDNLYSKASVRMMKLMGYKKGTGLGKHEQGRKGIVEASAQRGRRGLGFQRIGEKAAPETEWDLTKEKIDLHEEIEWIPEYTGPPPTLQELRRWAKEGPKKLTIDDETLFCDPFVLKEVLESKNFLDDLSNEELRRARTRSNPFETIRNVIFQNRAAMKMANMDAAFDFMFTNPVDPEGKELVSSDELLYFADVCAGPGGFSEYILWRKKWESKGFGFTLKGPNDFKLEEFYSGSPETFEPHYGIGGIHGDGDIFNPENVREFSRFVHENTDKKGVHIVMADGGFSVEGQENLQEILSKQLYLGQFFMALSILRPNGHFVCKLFDLFTPFSVGLVYLMYRVFHKVSIFKPNTSRPANSERYIICKWLRPDFRDVKDYMYELSCNLTKLTSSKSKEDSKNKRDIKNEQDINEVVPLELLNEDNFFNFMLNSNNKLGAAQVIHLAKIRAFANDPNLYEERQSDLRKECLHIWNIPDKVRSQPNRAEPEAKFRDLVKNKEVSFLDTKPDELTQEFLPSINSIHDYRCLVCGKDTLEHKDNKYFFLGLGRNHTFRWSGETGAKWRKFSEDNSRVSLELPADTLIYGEIVKELIGEGRGQKKVTAVHVIDALSLGGKDVQNLHYVERVKMIRKFVKALTKPTRTDLIPIRAKEVVRFKEIGKMFDKVCTRMAKTSGQGYKLSYDMTEDGRHFYPSGMLLVKTTKSPWFEEYSASKNRGYFYNKHNGKSMFEIPQEAVADFKFCFTNSKIWSWNSGVQILDEQHAEEDKVHRNTITNFINQKLKR